MIGISKYQQTRKIKEKKFDYKKYSNWIHSNNKVCVVCGGADIEIHHITDLYSHQLRTKQRRDDKRVVTLCKAHHKEGKEGIHILSKEQFYLEIMSLNKLLTHSAKLLEEYERSTL